MDKILDTVLLASTADEDRFVEVINAAIEAGDLVACPGWKVSTAPARKEKRRKKEAKERELFKKDQAEKTSKENGPDGSNNNGDLAALEKAIKQRGAERFDAMISRLEEKVRRTQFLASRVGG